MRQYLTRTALLVVLLFCAHITSANADLVTIDYSASFSGITNSGLPTGQVTGYFSYDTSAVGTNYLLYSVYPLVSFTMNDGASSLDFGNGANISIISTPTTSRFIAVGTQVTGAGDYTISIEGDGAGAFYNGSTALPNNLFAENFDYVGNIEQDSTSDAVGLYNISLSVPEPLTLSLFGAGLLGLGALRRRTPLRLRLLV